MYKELEKFKTGEKIPVNLSSPEVTSTQEIMLDEYKIGVGDLINNLIEHKKKSYWMRKNYHDHLTELYIEALNKITITLHL